jgi:diguanylate cyclase (GGDEF)-like protein
VTDLAIQIKERLLSIIELQNAIASMTAPADDVMRMAAERAASLTEATSATVSLVEGEELVAKAGAGVEVGKRIGVAHAGEVGKCVSERRPHRIDDHACVPIMYGEHAVGVIEIAGGRGGAFTDEDVDTLKLLSAICAIALHKAHSYPRPRADSTHDALTGLENRRAFDERVVTELGRSRRYGQSFSLAILDLAGFSAANDRLGQATGEKILRDIASILKAHTRVIDACFRLGGDEFAIVMPGTSLEGANILADRCRAQIATATVGDASITASFGVVESTTETMPEPLLARASDALMAAKHGNSHT